MALFGSGASMCDLSHHHHADFGFIVDVPEIRALIDETRRVSRSIPNLAARVDALRPAFARLLAADGWLPEEFAQPDRTSGMGGGIGQYALFRLSLIHISEPTRQAEISYAVFCLK